MLEISTDMMTIFLDLISTYFQWKILPKWISRWWEPKNEYSYILKYLRSLKKMTPKLGHKGKQITIYAWSNTSYVQKSYYSSYKQLLASRVCRTRCRTSSVRMVVVGFRKHSRHSSSSTTVVLVVFFSPLQQLLL